MRLLLDTQLILWLSIVPERLSPAAREVIEDRANELLFSAISLWEVAIKHAIGRKDFHVDAAILKAALLDDGYSELPFTGAHAIAVGQLPPIHRDPFDRALVAQAVTEGVALVTADRTLGSYPGTMRV